MQRHTAIVPPLPIDDRTGLDPATRATLEALLEEHGNLQSVVRWAFAGGHALLDVVGQDEFTNDVCIQWTEDLVLVYDAT